MPLPKNKLLFDDISCNRLKTLSSRSENKKLVSQILAHQFL